LTECCSLHQHSVKVLASFDDLKVGIRELSSLFLSCSLYLPKAAFHKESTLA